MGKAGKTPERPTSPVLLGISVREWLRHADSTRAVFWDGSSDRTRTFWRQWARYVLDLSAIEGADFRVEAIDKSNPGEAWPLEGVPRGPFLRGLAGMLSARVDQYPPTSAEHHATLLEATCMMLDAAKAEKAHDETALNTARAATIIGNLLSDARAQWMLPDAKRGRKSLQSTRDAARAKAEKARRESAAIEWREEVETRRGGSAEAAYARIERREGLASGSVKKAIMRLRKRAKR